MMAMKCFTKPILGFIVRVPIRQLYQVWSYQAFFHTLACLVNARHVCYNASEVGFFDLIRNEPTSYSVGNFPFPAYMGVVRCEPY